MVGDRIVRSSGQASFLACGAVLAFALLSLLACEQGGGGASSTDLAGRDRGDVMREVLAMQEGPERTARFVSTLVDLDGASARALADVLAAANETVPLYERRVLYLGWAEFDPDAALQHVLSLPGDAVRSPLAVALIRRLSAEDPARARSVVLSLPEEESEGLRSALLVGLVQGWAAGEHDLEPIARLLEQVPKGWNRERATRVIMDELLERDEPDDAMAWAESIPVGGGDNYRAVAFRKVALVVGEKYPRRVAAWLEPHREHRFGQAGLRVLARTWGNQDPVAALDWAVAQPDDRGRFLAVKFAFDSWLQSDESAARTWLAGRPDDPVLDPAYLILALRVGPRDPVGASDAAMRIHDQKMRGEALAQVVGPWLEKAPAAARSWLDRNGIDTVIEERIRAEEAADDGPRDRPYTNEEDFELEAGGGRGRGGGGKRS